MIIKSQLAIEGNAVSATAYVGGRLTVGLAARVIMACRALPPAVCSVSVDLRAVSVFDGHALTMLESYIVDWSAERRGMSRVVYPHLRGRDAFVAIPCAIRDAPDAELRPERDDRVVLVPPYPVW